MTAGLASDWQVTCLGRLIGPALAGPHLAGPALAGLLHQFACCGRPVDRPQIALISSKTPTTQPPRTSMKMERSRDFM